MLQTIHRFHNRFSLLGPSPGCFLYHHDLEWCSTKRLASKYMAGCDLEDTFYWPIVDCQSLLSYWRRVLDIFQSRYFSVHLTIRPFYIQHFMFKYPAYSHRQAVCRVSGLGHYHSLELAVDTLFTLTITCRNRISYLITLILTAHSVHYKTHPWRFCYQGKKQWSCRSISSMCPLFHIPHLSVGLKWESAVVELWALDRIFTHVLWWYRAQFI